MAKRGEIIKRSGQEHRQALVKLIKQAAHSDAIWRIWDDIMFMFAVTLSQPFNWVQKREDEYLRRIQHYDKKTQDLFPSMLTEIVLALKQEGLVDMLGEVYMELELSNHWKGQHFTYSDVTALVAELTFSHTAEQIKQHGYITMHDSTAGAGSMLFAFAEVCKKNDINYQRDVLFVAQDIDFVAAYMCYIQMSLLGMPGYVIIGDSLLNPPTGKMNPECDYLYTPMYYIRGFQRRRRRKPTN